MATVTPERAVQLIGRIPHSGPTLETFRNFTRKSNRQIEQVGGIYRVIDEPVFGVSDRSIILSNEFDVPEFNPSVRLDLYDRPLHAMRQLLRDHRVDAAQERAYDTHPEGWLGGTFTGWVIAPEYSEEGLKVEFKVRGQLADDLNMAGNEAGWVLKMLNYFADRSGEHFYNRGGIPSPEWLDIASLGRELFSFARAYELKTPS